MNSSYQSYIARPSSVTPSPNYTRYSVTQQYNNPVYYRTNTSIYEPRVESYFQAPKVITSEHQFTNNPVSQPTNLHAPPVFRQSVISVHQTDNLPRNSYVVNRIENSPIIYPRNSHAIANPQIYQHNQDSYRGIGHIEPRINVTKTPESVPFSSHVPTTFLPKERSMTPTFKPPSLTNHLTSIATDRTRIHQPAFVFAPMNSNQTREVLYKRSDHSSMITQSLSGNRDEGSVTHRWSNSVITQNLIAQSELSKMESNVIRVKVSDLSVIPKKEKIEELPQNIQSSLQNISDTCSVKSANFINFDFKKSEKTLLNDVKKFQIDSMKTMPSQLLNNDSGSFEKNEITSINTNKSLKSTQSFKNILFKPKVEREDVSDSFISDLFEKKTRIRPKKMTNSPEDEHEKLKIELLTSRISPKKNFKDSDTDHEMDLNPQVNKDLFMKRIKACGQTENSF